MRSLIAGLVLAIIFLTLMFAAPRFLPGGIDGVTRVEIAQLNSGFSGTKHIGSWTLVCSPAKSAASNVAVGRCRMARGYKDKFGRTVMAVAFRYAGAGKQLTMIVDYPHVGEKGQFLTLALASKMNIRLPVYGCNKTECVAVGALIPAAESLLVAAPLAQVLLPPGADGKQFTIGIGLDGLAPALDGLHRAEL